MSEIVTKGGPEPVPTTPRRGFVLNLREIRMNQEQLNEIKKDLDPDFGEELQTAFDEQKPKTEEK